MKSKNLSRQNFTDFWTADQYLKKILKIEKFRFKTVYAGTYFRRKSLTTVNGEIYSQDFFKDFADICNIITYSEGF